MPFFYIRQEKSEAWRVQLGTLLAVDAGFYRILFPGESDPVDMRVPWAVSLQHRGGSTSGQAPKDAQQSKCAWQQPVHSAMADWQICTLST